jgi:hypothetical protein
VQALRWQGAGVTRSLARPYVERILGLTRRRIEIFDGAGEDWRFAESLKSISEDTAQEYEGRAVLELVQNGHDALGQDERGRIAVVLDLTEEPGALYVANEGRPFTDDNFRAITEFALSDKGASEGIGNKGLGFRSVLQLTDWPEIYSRSGPGSPTFDGYCFRFAAEQDLAPLIDDPTLLRRVVDQVSPLALPVPALPQGEVLDDLREQGYSTVVRLPLQSGHAAAAAREQIARLAADDAPLLLFLDRVRALTAEVLHRDRGADSPPEVDLGRAVEPTALTGPDTPWAQEVDLGQSGRYLLARRPLDAGPLSEAIACSVAAHELDQRWADWDGSGAWVGLALRLDRPLDAGRLYTFLPMAAAAPAPLCAHAHAPFFTKLARLSMSDGVPLNAYLLDELAALSAQLLRAVRDYAPGAIAAGLVPDLACWYPPARLNAVLDGGLENEPLIPLAGGRGWAPLSTAYDWPDDARPWAELTRQALAQRGRDLLDAAAVGQPRQARIAKLHQALLGALMRPSSELTAEWAEDIAGSLPPPEATAALARWAAFYDDVQQVFRSDPIPLRGRRIVLDQAGALRRALGGDGPGRDDTLFFSPEHSSADSPARIPSDLRALRARMAFTHPDIPWSKGARAFFETGQLVREYRADRVYDAMRDLLATSRSDAQRRDALAFAFRQFPSLNAAQRSALRGVGFYVPRGDGSWALASHSLMSPGWATEGALRLERFLTAAGDRTGELAVLRTLRIARPDGWPGGVADTDAYAQFLSSIGVRDGLPLTEVGPVSERQGGQLAPFIIARQYGLPEAVAAGWAEDVAAVWNGGAHPQTRYQFSHAVRTLPGDGDLPALGPAARRELAELIALGLANWDDEAFAVTVWRPTRPYGQQDAHRWPTPLASALRHLPWLPVASSDDDGEGGGGMRFVAPSAAWYSPDGDLPPFVPSMPLALRRLLSDPRALDRAIAAGLRR